MPALPAFFRRSPRSLREADLLARHGRRLVHRRRDLLGEAALADLDGHLARLERAVRERDEPAAREASGRLDPLLVRLSHHRDEANWRENCEVILMAIVVAVAVRAYFFQPFKIPTGSMQPTLNGIIARPVAADKPAPGVVGGFFQGFFLGRSYLEVRATADDRIAAFREYERPLFGFLSFYKQTGTQIICQSGRIYDAGLTFGNVPQAILDGDRGVEGTFRLRRGQSIRAGETFLRGYIETGDQVFVDKLTYHFRAPRRDDVFVFRTTGITGIPMSDPNVLSQFYIKRLAGVPGDTLRIAAPELFINGRRAEGYGYNQVMSGTREQPNRGYRGYGNLPSAARLVTPTETFTAPPDGYIALGDNSYNSLDSRYWGPVPARNLVGRGFFVYWPFTRHWGLIR